MKDNHAVLTGTQPNSISWTISAALMQEGWHTWLYGRNAEPKDDGLLHIRQCDVTNYSQITTLIGEIPQIHLAVQMADSGTAFGEIENLTSTDVRLFIETKITGSILLTQAILRKTLQQKGHTMLVWAAGKPTNKDKDIILFGPVNSALLELVNEINQHYKDILSAYYMVTGLIMPSTQGKRYLEKCHKKEENSDPPSVLSNTILGIIHNEIMPGMIKPNQEKLL